MSIGKTMEHMVILQHHAAVKAGVTPCDEITISTKNFLDWWRELSRWCSFASEEATMSSSMQYTSPIGRVQVKHNRFLGNDEIIFGYKIKIEPYKEVEPHIEVPGYLS